MIYLFYSSHTPDKYGVQDYERHRDDRAGHRVGQLEEVGVQGVRNKTFYDKQTVCRYFIYCLVSAEK